MEPVFYPVGFSSALRRVSVLLVVFASTSVSLWAAEAAIPSEVDSKLEALERSKWAMPPPMIFAMCGDDFLSVEYGFDAVPRTRRVNMAFSKSQEFPPMPEGMEPPKFELDAFRFVHATPESVVVSYHVKGLSFPFDAYGTSVWAQRDGKWVTVFYQATLTSPDSPGLNDHLP
jgi:hypothetical protein